MMPEKEFEGRILEMMKDKTFVEELAAKATPEDVQAFLASKGISCTLDQVKQFGKALKEQSEKKELSAGDLEGVSGGGFFDLIKGLAGDFWDWIYN